jgi:hypothetical protein
MRSARFYAGARARNPLSGLFGTTEVVPFHKTEVAKSRALLFTIHSAVKLRNGWGTRPHGLIERSVRA